MPTYFDPIMQEDRAIVKCCVWDKLFIKRRPVLIAH
ncbi:Uncharacterised protein [Legionella pneumophila]|nr:Uncharacterised protein [Legionella pneumophila]